MKKFYFTLVTFLFLAVANAQIVNIPDANFKAKLLSANFNNSIASIQTPSNYGSVFLFNKIDINNDGEIQVSEAVLIKYLSIGSSNISSLEGINEFVNLESLNCQFNLLVTLDVNNLIKLKILNCNNNQLQSMYLDGLIDLNVLNCRSNQLTNINVNGLINLKNLFCSYNQLTILNVNELTSLEILECINNQLAILNLNNLINLQDFKCDRNDLSNVDVSGLTSLITLSCNENEITSLNLSQLNSLQTLSCAYNSLSSINLNDLINLRTLYCLSNQLAELNVISLVNLQYLNCGYNQLSTLDISGLSNLVSLGCQSNYLNSLFLKNNNSYWLTLAFSNNPNIEHICIDQEDILYVQNILNQYGYTNCTVDSNCNLSVDTNLYDNNYFTIYPNPVAETFSLQAKQNAQILSLSIYTMLGQLVQTVVNPTSTLDVADLKTGTYFVKITTDKGVSSSKFVKE